MKNKLKALVIEPVNPIKGSWGVVNMTRLLEDGTWECGKNLITSIENVVEQAEQKNVPIITRKYMETKLKNENEK